MNILIPHNWLKEHLETDASPEDIQRLVSLSGPSIERINEVEGEPVYDIEVTTNRVDSMSVRGIARESAVILQQAGTQAALKPAQLPDVPSPAKNKPLPTINNNPDLCKRITCVVLSHAQHTPTPDWMAKRLKQIDQNVHDAAIDITNYITHELGHPCHAFDYDKIMALGGVINVTEAEAGKKFTTLDGEEYETLGGEVVFENDKGEIIDLPAIKGTANTAVDNNTKNILLWLESINAEKVRYGSMSHAIRTVAAQLNEKNVDPTLASDVLQRGVELYQQLCNAQVASQVYDDFPHKPEMGIVKVSTEKIATYLGINLDQNTITQILESLGCQVNWPVQTEVTVTPPTFRPDITIPADVIEELARIYGYHNLPSKLMDTAIPTNKPADAHFDIEHRIKQFLADLGWQEVYTYSMVSEELALQSGNQSNEHLQLQNPLTDDRVYLRRSLIPSLQEVLEINPEHPQLCVFEIANVYHPQANDLPQQELHLTLASQLNYRQSRGVLEALLAEYYLEPTIKPLSQTEAEILIEENKIGKVVANKKRIYFDIKLNSLFPLLKNHPTYKPLPKAAPVVEDMTFELPSQTPVGEVMTTIQAVDAAITAVKLVDIYKQNHSFAMTYSRADSSLSSDEVAPIRKKIVEAVSQQHQGKLIGSV